MKDKAVSSVLGYTMILAIVVAVLSLVFSHTYYLVGEAKEKVKYESLAQGFEKIQNMINYVAYSGTYNRYVRILLSGGSMSVGKGGYIELKVYNTSGLKPIYTFNGYTGSIEYAYKNYKISFENGGVWLKSSGETIVSAPRIFIYKKVIHNQTVFFMSLIILNGSGAVGGNSFVGVNVKFNSSKVRVFGPGYAKLNITSDYAKAWYDFFNRIKRGNQNNAEIQTLLEGNKVYVTIHFSEMILTKYNLNVKVE